MSSTFRSIIDSATATASSATPSCSERARNSWKNNSKPSQLYVYPSVAVIIFLLAGIHICRFFDSQRLARRRMAERQAHEDAALDRWRRAAGLGAIKWDSYAPRMFTALLRKPEDDERSLGSKEWGHLLPISANIKKPPIPQPPISSPSSPPSTLSSSTLRKLKLATTRTTFAFRNSFYFILRRQPPQPPPRSLRPPAPSSVTPDATAEPKQPEYVYRPQTLVTGVLIAMPNARRPFHRTPSSSSSFLPASSSSLSSSPSDPHLPPIFIDSPPEEELPEVALGYTETDWSRYGKPGDDHSDEEEPKEFKSSIIRASLEGALFDRPW
ncbi:hypothetical protein M407DRAFT_171818 [Tulasnella calospora MUT 4182]|uniref:Uncharacterized protein n=1 Tax=Tulasnella calospora MUT 4182 TaxID=1051891 RepID=A0A0C3QDW8_9AGAM|nr:hypothetical protein M407DRAFT_171818 [Tulasnella calospora MUT 4182]